ncbi:MAG: anti-phage dCTP deaminase [Devosia marina]|uniref:anti-phage dCTP deaminase n=1 Tax=Devosia marina TaxID=2683198 RepID=UPI0032EEE19C
MIEESTEYPELFFGLVGPIGVDMDAIASKLRAALIAVGYIPVDIRVTALMEQIVVDGAVDDSADPLRRYKSRIDYANAVRKKCMNDAALAALAIQAIRNVRSVTHENNGRTPPEGTALADLPLFRHAYIIRQFKRKEEIDLLRQAYGRKFVQISANLSQLDRVKTLARKIATQNPNYDQKACEAFANALVDQDLDERAVDHGQRVGDVFHMGDVFVDARNEAAIERTTRRFIDALFGKNSVSPTIDEYGTYIAASAALRSLDTSRQVGAAIFSSQGEVVSLGTNEVPKAGGGTYWTDSNPPHRDFDEGHDANNTNKRRVLFDTVKRLFDGGFIQSDKHINELFNDISTSAALDDALILDITEFGRMTHAEMNALTDSARLGRSTSGATLYCTTFPCHNCAKHIVAAGIKRVVFIEPYPKSKALELHYDSITLERDEGTRVLFEHFSGISPRRYRDIFEKQKRRNSDGTLREWYENHPIPRIEDKSPYYVLNEPSAILSALAEVAAELGIEIEDEPQSPS